MPQQHHLPSEYMWAFRDRCQQQLRSLERQISELENALLGETSLAEAGEDRLTAEQPLATSMRSISSSVRLAAGGSVYSDGPGDIVPYNDNISTGAYYTTPRQQSHPSLAREGRPLAVGRRGGGDQRMTPDVIRRVLAAEHAAILRLAGGNLAAVHDKVEQMRNLLKALLNGYKRPSDVGYYDPFMRADEKESMQQKQREEQRKLAFRKLEQQHASKQPSATQMQQQPSNQQLQAQQQPSNPQLQAQQQPSNQPQQLQLLQTQQQAQQPSGGTSLSGGLFGAQPPAQSGGTSSLFGAPTASGVGGTPATPSMWTTTAPASSAASGGSSLFGANPPGGGSSLFGATAASTATPSAPRSSGRRRRR